VGEAVLTLLVRAHQEHLAKEIVEDLHQVMALTQLVAEVVAQEPLVEMVLIMPQEVAEGMDQPQALLGQALPMRVEEVVQAIQQIQVVQAGVVRGLVMFHQFQLRQ